MSQAREFDLALRRERLLMRSAALRSALADQSVLLETPLAVADRVNAGARWLYRQRGWVAGGVAVVLVVRPRRAWRLLCLGWWAWRHARRAQGWLAAAGLLAPAGASPRQY
jgi:YqjK-like protein